VQPPDPVEMPVATNYRMPVSMPMPTPMPTTNQVPASLHPSAPRSSYSADSNPSVSPFAGSDGLQVVVEDDPNPRQSPRHMAQYTPQLPQSPHRFHLRPESYTAYAPAHAHTPASARALAHAPTHAPTVDTHTQRGRYSDRDFLHRRRSPSFHPDMPAQLKVGVTGYPTQGADIWAADGHASASRGASGSGSPAARHNVYEVEAHERKPDGTDASVLSSPSSTPDSAMVSAVGSATTSSFDSNSVATFTPDPTCTPTGFTLDPYFGTRTGSVSDSGFVSASAPVSDPAPSSGPESTSISIPDLDFGPGGSTVPGSCAWF